jgi:hypothetical protein
VSQKKNKRKRSFFYAGSGDSKDFLPLKFIDVGIRGRFQYLSSLAKSEAKSPKPKFTPLADSDCHKKNHQLVNMARTKQSACHSTGGKAPRIHLSTKAARVAARRALRRRGGGHCRSQGPPSSLRDGPTSDLARAFGRSDGATVARLGQLRERVSAAHCRGGRREGQCHDGCGLTPSPQSRRRGQATYRR